MNIPPSLCVKCRGAKYLCGLTYCPILADIINIKPLNASIIEGYTPPSVFVGRVGYPKVSIGPMIPYVQVDEYNTSLYDNPEAWNKMSIKDILMLRLTLVRGKYKVHVDQASDADSKIIRMQEVAMADRPIDAKMHISKVNMIPSISDTIPPFGPSVEIKSLELGNVSVNASIEKIYYDDLHARDAIIQLYKENISVSSIVRALSVGCLGMKRRRRLLPTRWSITAVDDTLSRFLVDGIKDKQWVNEPLVYLRETDLNRFLCIILPGTWEFEWIEAWYPNTVWNHGARIEIIGDHEGYNGLKHYAIVGGCYYSARLAATEYLKSINRQGRVLMLREIYPGFNIPIGVWFVREQLRAMFKRRPLKFASVEEAVKHAISKLEIPLNEWVKHSYTLGSLTGNRSIMDYIT